MTIIQKLLVPTAVAVLITAAPALAQNPARTDNRRTVYLTLQLFDPSQAVNACAAGHHMASVFELLDPSNLKYDTTLGVQQEDSGQGPLVGGPVGFARE